MLMTKRKPASVGEILVQEFMVPMGLTQGVLAEAILARVFGNSPDFWLNVQRRSDLWAAMHSPRERERIKRARPLGAAA
jgi:plasmid maintenance system antidote protein VapI